MSKNLLERPTTRSHLQFDLDRDQLRRYIEPAIGGSPQ